MKKQSSIEWFYQRILAKDINEVFEQAKEMHKQEIIKAYKEGSKEGVRYYIDTDWGDDTKHIRGDEFYKNTYEKTR